VKLLGFRNSSPYLPYPPIPFLLHSRFRIIFLTNGSHCAIILLKNRDSNLTGARAEKRGHSSMPSRRESAGKYWNFSPFLGLKGTLYFVLRQRIALEKRAPFAPKTHKKDRFCPRYARADRDQGRALTTTASQVRLASDKQSGVTCHGNPAAPGKSCKQAELMLFLY